MSKRVDRRRALATLAASFGALPLAGCDFFSQNPTVRKVLDSAESLTMHAQRLLVSRQALAQEFTEADISADFRANGSTDPDDDAYQTFAQSGFKDWRFRVAGLVGIPCNKRFGITGQLLSITNTRAQTASRAGAASASAPASRSVLSCSALASNPMPDISCSIARTALVSGSKQRTNIMR